jgi:tRNA(Ile)-lysidine synthase
LIPSIKTTLTDLNVVPSSRILIGVSGGVDSMVLLMALKELGYPVTACHVNFQLRGQDSDDDASFVEKWCKNNLIDYVEHVVNTKDYVAIHRLNTQSAAREIRYDLWDKLMDSSGYDFMATAHHRDDRIETLFLNLLRGTGIKGLRGIPVQRDYFIRPMIDIPRSQIESFSRENNIPFRTDISNESDDYQRNRIRHHLIPLLNDLNPNLDSVMSHSLRRINLEWNAWEASYQNWIEKNVIEYGESFDLNASRQEFAFLLKWLEERNIPWSLANDFISSDLAESSKILEHGGYRLSRTRIGFHFEIIENFSSIIISSPGIFQFDNGEISIEQVPFEEFSSHSDPFTEYADLTEVRWPLELRAIQAGDKFQPIGMKGQTKKLQDYLVDLKLEFHQKKQIRILASSDQILWIIGKRLDERVKVKPDSKEIFRLRFRKS